MRKMIVFLMVVGLLSAGCGGSRGSGEPEAGNGGGAGTPAAAETEVREPTSPGPSLPTGTVRIETGDGEVAVDVEIADDATEMARGLMGRTALAEDAGMLFVYPEERELSFWMRDTLIPLSIAFIDARGRIVDLQDMRPLDDRPPHYVSPEPVRYALEVNEGFFEERNVEVGDRAELPV